METGPTRSTSTAALRSLAVTAAFAAAVTVSAQDRPAEDDLFGGSPQPSTPADAPTPIPPTVKEDPLKIGGQIYLQALGQWRKDEPPADWSLSAPALVDGYLDVRPNDRVRGFLLARFQYDLSRSTSDGAELLQTENPQLTLDQLWINFDVDRVAFVTAGKQHVKWGVSRFWNPTDFLHPVPRDPLKVFDARAGQTMLKLHVPWEKRGWNFYGMAVFDESKTEGLVRNIGGALRAEMVFGAAEIGVDGLFQREKDARVGIDFSAGVWDVDLYGEAALRKGTDAPLLREATGSGTPALLPGYEKYTPTDFRPAVTLGANWSYKYNDDDTLTLGAEYFYNSTGYSDPTIYPALLVQQVQEQASYFVPFYLGKHYAGAYLLLPNPGSWNDTTLTLSTIGNLSDRTFVTRLDASVVVLTYLTVEAFVAGHYGHRVGEFRFSADLGPYKVSPVVLDLGLALRVGL